MIGRAAIGKPEIFAECLGKSISVNKVSQIKQHIKIMQQFLDDKIITLAMRGIVCHYLKSISGTSALKVNISKAATITEILQLLSNFFAKN